MMRSLIAIIVTLLFTGLMACGSEFDKCMTAEVPRAEKSLGLSVAYSRLEQATEYKETLEAVADIWDNTANWRSLNPEPQGYPEYPKFECSDMSFAEFEMCRDNHDLKVAEYQKEKEAYKASAEYEEWLTKEADYYTVVAPEFNAAGIAGSTKEELNKNLKQWDDSHHNLRRERALAFDCWGSSDCDRPQVAELKLTFGSDWSRNDEQVVSFQMQEGARLVDYFSDELIALRAKIPEVATLMCNRAGIYK